MPGKAMKPAKKAANKGAKKAMPKKKMPAAGKYSRGY
tara:strand:- start:1306 stop:1416 length:111 start_codon:yes stop_codon:yes gene_type:complete